MGGSNIQCFDVYLITKVNIFSEGEGSRGRRALDRKYVPLCHFPISSSMCVMAQLPEKPLINQCQGSDAHTAALVKLVLFLSCHRRRVHL